MKQANRQIKQIVAGNIRAAREDAGLTQRQLARQVNDIDTLAVWRWEKGEAIPNPINFAAMADALGHDVAWFYVDREQEAA